MGRLEFLPLCLLKCFTIIEKLVFINSCYGKILSYQAKIRIIRICAVRAAIVCLHDPSDACMVGLILVL